MSFINLFSCTFTLFAVIDIIGTLPMIINIKKTANISPHKTSVFSAIIMLVFLFFGSYIFEAFGIQSAHFAVAGSLLILFFGVKMMFGLHFDYEDNKTGEPNSSLFPVAFPLIAGPGTLSTIMSFKSQYNNLEIISSIVINAIIILLIIKSSDWIGKKLGGSGITIVERIFGVFLLSIGIKMFITNLLTIIEIASK